MKSILVDALRQASSDDTESDHALTDSGSFDVSSDEFEATANDEAGGDSLVMDGELALMETSKALEVPVETVEPPQESEGHSIEEILGHPETGEEPAVGEDPDTGVGPEFAAAEEALRQTTELAIREPDESHAVTIVGELPRPVPPQKAPVLARLAPLLCMAMAATVAGGWLLYQKFGVAHGAFGSSALIAQTRAAHTPGIPETAQAENPDSRFPFLPIENDRDVERVVQ